MQLIQYRLPGSRFMVGQGVSGYCPADVLDSSYFFTANLLRQGNNDLLVRHIDLLRDAVRRVRSLPPALVIDA